MTYAMVINGWDGGRFISLADCPDEETATALLREDARDADGLSDEEAAALVVSRATWFIHTGPWRNEDEGDHLSMTDPTECPGCVQTEGWQIE